MIVVEHIVHQSVPVNGIDYSLMAINRLFFCVNESDRLMFLQM